ncbi:restriction endonuclease subunit S [Halovulum sp. GXIMD14794]
MNAERLLEVYEQISEAPDAIARLRRFVLDLAVRGKLVEQDAADEPAARLAQRIEERKAKVLSETGMRKPRKVAEMDPAEIWADLPASWTWTQISKLGFISPRNEADDDVEASFVPMPMIFAEYGLANDHEVRPWKEIKKGYTHFAEGDVGLAKITPCFENGKSTVFRNLTGGFGSGTTELHILRPVLVDPDYVVLFLKSPQFIETGIPKMTGTAGQKRVSSEYFTSSPFPLPPLAEQHRIVAKVGELMALCDRLEEARTTREEVRDKLTAASLARLTAPATTAEDFPTHATFALEALPALTTRPDQIKTLRQTILNLAVRGRLVAQDAADEPVLDYLLGLEEVPAKTRKLLCPLNSAELGGDLPQSWVWLSLGAIIRGMDAGWSPQCENQPRSNEDEWGVLKTTAVQALAFDSMQHKLLPTKLKPRPEYQAEVGDILVTRAGPKNRVGVSCVVDVPCPRLMISDKLIRFHALGDLSPRYIALTLNAGITFERIETAKSGMAVMQMNISQVKLKAIPVPLPPLAEQHRIVAKVDALLALCDRLEAALTTADTTRTRLLEALLHEALEPAEAREAAA